MMQKVLLLFVFIAPIFTVNLSYRAQVGQHGVPDHGRPAVLNICDVSYFADPTGKQDCTEAILCALDDVTRATQLSWRQTLAELEALPSEGIHYLNLSAENRKEHGVVRATTHVRLPYLPTIYFPKGTYLVSDILRYRHKDMINAYGSEMNQQIRMRGAGTKQTVIRLRDHAPGFGKPESKAFVAGDAQMRVSTTTYGWGTTSYYGTAIYDKVGEKTVIVKAGVSDSAI